MTEGHVRWAERDSITKWGLIRRYVASQRLATLVMALLIVATIGLQILEPRIIAHIIQSVEDGATRAAIVMLALAFLTVAVVRQITAVGTALASERVAWTATNAIRADSVRHILGQDHSFYSSHSAGDLIERVDGDVNEMSELFSTVLVRLGANLVLALAIAVALMFVDPLVGILILALLAAAVVGIGRIGPVAHAHAKEERRHSAGFFGYLSEVLRATEDVRAAAATRFARTGMTRRLRAWQPATVRANVWGTGLWTGVFAVLTGATAVAYLTSALLFDQGRIQLSEVYLIVAYTMMLSAPLEAVQEEMQTYNHASASIGRVVELLSVRPTIQYGDARPTPGPHSVRFRSVRFRYQVLTEPEVTVNRRYALDDVSFTIEAGQKVGVIGRTGAGKSTIVRLICHHYDPESGAVLLDGRDLRHLSAAAMRGRIGYVSQRVQIFDASLRNNLTFFDPDITDSRLLAAITDSGLGGWFEGLPLGLDTPISESAMSGGEAQLVAFARVLLEDPGLVVLDEPTSRLDPAAERQLRLAMASLLDGRTAIVIAHRLETLENMDRIMLIDDGRVLAYDETSTLLASRASDLATLRHLREVR